MKLVNAALHRFHALAERHMPKRNEKSEKIVQKKVEIFKK